MAVKVGRELWQHAFECGLLASGSVLAAALVAPALGVHLWQLALGEAAIGLIAGLLTLKLTDSMSLAVYWLICGLYATGWTVAAHFMGTWDRVVLGTLGLGALGLTPAGMYLWASWRAEVERQNSRQLAITTNLGHKLWADRFAAAGFPDIIIVDVQPTFAGHEIHLRLPGHGLTTLTMLKGAVERMETAWRLREGALRFARAGKLRSDVVLHVTEKEVLEQVIPFPTELVPRSINEPFPIGMLENGEYAMVTFREIGALIAGVRNGGKSSLLKVFIAQLAQCVDCVIWMIDLKGGRAAAPWLESWVANPASRRPVLDWVATTPEEAELMLDCFNLWIDLRSRHAGGKEKVIPSTREPALVLIVDEMAKVFGQGFGAKSGNKEGTPTNSQLSNKAKNAVVLGRSEAMDAICATQRGTVTMTGDGDLKSQLQLRIGLGTTTAGDAMSVFPGDVQAQKRLVALSKIPGAGIIEHEESDLVPFKSFWIDPDKGDVRKIADWCERHTAAQPERVLIEAAGSAYADRWQRQHGQDLIRQVAARDLPADEDETFEDIVRSIEAEGVNPVRKRVREIVMEAGRIGVSPGMICKWLERENIEHRRETVNRWLVDDSGPGGMFEVRRPGTPQVRYAVAPPRLITGDEPDTGTDG